MFSEAITDDRPTRIDDPIIINADNSLFRH